MNPRDRIELAKHFNKLGFKSGAEIGVADGRYAKILCENISDLHLYAIDTWMPYDGNWRSQKYQDEAYKQAKEKLATFNVTVCKRTSIRASLDIENESLDFVFIDGDHHFDYIMEDIIAWSRKVRKGGIISGHDYYQFSSGGIIQAVNAYVEAHSINLNLTLRNKGEKDDRVPCWWFVKV